MSRKLPFLVAAVAGGLLSGAALAQEAPSAPATAAPTTQAAPDAAAPAPGGAKPERFVAMFEKLDKNGDGIVEKAEFDVVRVKAFDRLDTNKDGRITAEEVETIAEKRNWPDARREKMLKRIGVTTPQGVTKEEYLARKTVFERIDVDGNGKVTLTEVETFVDKVKDRQAAKAAKQAN